MDNIKEDKEIDIEVTVDIWKKVVDVQMHFNDLCLRLRTVAVTVLGALLGAAAAAFKFGGIVFIFKSEVPTTAIFFAISIIVWFAFYLMDRFWYHELLRGAVHQGEIIETDLIDKVPAIALAKKIREQSHLSLNMRAANKLNIFYLSIFAIQLIALLFVIFSHTPISG